MSELIGRTLSGRYRVDAFLGKGGMAEVYKVWDPKRSVYLALKLLHADLAEDKIFIRRFQREAATLAKLQHPNIVRFYGLEQDGPLVFILMDYVQGTTLRREIFESKGPFTHKRVLEIMQPVCAALHYAHESGFVHCDVKPANIMLDRKGNVLVSDFGIARMSESSTSTLVGVGTPAYMAPEQVRGEPPTPQTDIYSLGIILYELMTGGERPFTGASAPIVGSFGEKIRWEQVNAAPRSPRFYNRALPPAPEQVILRCLEKQAAHRFSTTNGLLNALLGALSDRKRAGKPKAAVPTPRSQKKLFAALPRLGSVALGRRGALVAAKISGILVVLGVLILVVLILGSLPSVPDLTAQVAPAASAFATLSIPSPKPTSRILPKPTSTIMSTVEVANLVVQIAVERAYLRKLPTFENGAENTIPGGYVRNDTFILTGRTVDGEWFYATGPDGTHGWLYAEHIIIQGGRGIPPPVTGTPSPPGAGITILEEADAGGIFLRISGQDLPAGYRVGPLAAGVYAVGPNRRFLVYVTSRGRVYGLRLGNSQVVEVANIAHNLIAIERNEEPSITLSFVQSGSSTYLVIVEGRYSESISVELPRALTD